LLLITLLSVACSRPGGGEDEAKDDCPINHVIDGKFTGWPEVTECAEWDKPALKGVYAELYLDYVGKTVFLLNDWHLRKDGPIGPDFYNRFQLATSNGKVQWVIKVYGDNRMEVTRNDVPWDPAGRGKGASGFGPSPLHGEPHTMYEFRLSPVSPGPFWLTEKDPGGGPLTDPDDSLVQEPTAFVGNFSPTGGVTVSAGDGPVLVAASPQKSPPGTPLELHGLSLGDKVGVVTFDSTAAAVVSWADARIQVILPNIGGPVQVTVNTADGKQSNSILYDPTCAPDCGGKSCGDDGCGTSCGDCKKDFSCAGGACVCAPKCQGKQCGDDGCGAACGTCTPPDECNVYGQCICPVDCSGKDCGPNGCGGTCGTCTGGKICKGDLCVTKPVDCDPDCADKKCGDDGCGGSCGSCGGADTCVKGACKCVPNCKGKTCGSDGCGGSCGTCKGGVCWAALCCVADCQGKACGDDSCGGSCGDCQAKNG